MDPLGFRTTRVYDAADRLIATIDPLNNRTTNVYDALSERPLIDWLLKRRLAEAAGVVS